jgi:hypothetical protein
LPLPPLPAVTAFNDMPVDARRTPAPMPPLGGCVGCAGSSSGACDVEDCCGSDPDPKLPREEKDRARALGLAGVEVDIIVVAGMNDGGGMVVDNDGAPNDSKLKL